MKGDAEKTRWLRLATLAAPVAAALLIHPFVGASSWLPGQAGIVAGLAVLVASLLLLRGLTDRRLLVMAVGSIVVVTGLGYDSFHGFRGNLSLRPGQAVKNVDEAGVGAATSLRPLGFEIGLESVDVEGRFHLFTRAGTGMSPLRLSPGEGVAVGGIRLGAPRLTYTGDVAALDIRVRLEGQERLVRVVPGDVVRVGGLEIGLAQYFPDFELVNGAPRSRSLEPRNPAVLLSVRRGEESFPVFVIRGLPDLHSVEALSATFALVSVEADQIVRVPVAREPGALLGGLGLVILAFGVPVAWRWA